MKGKRILINACMIAHQPSGVGIYSIELLKELIIDLEKEKFEYTIYCYNVVLLEELKINFVKKISLGFIFDKLLKKKIVIHRHIWNIIVLNFLSAKYDILYSFSSHGTLYHRNQIITIHDLICLSFPNSHKSQYYYFKFFLPYLIRQSKHVIAISNFTKAEILKNYYLKNDKISVVYNGINHLENLDGYRQNDFWLNDITNGRPYCLIVGASYIHKNIETLFKVCERMKDTNAKFIILNRPNKYFSSLQKKAKDLQLNNVTFLNNVENYKLAQLYKKARLNIYISLYEGFGFPPAEASLFCTQSLLSNKTALIEIYGEDFEFSDPFDLNRIERIIFKYIGAEKKIEVKSYLNLKQKYNWKKTAKETTGIFMNSINMA